ncbi:hypothetical protein PCC7418_2220 [Halothece sp. PCC 7418]|uniref:DUF7219 family protein n=1 Tax=Halothece sp. (strain PCC 7418) TaxID=65093 RepID=UPI0002A078B0|nr:hypothetical protein [Halothece sp. PCC 7418]AFZ44374.1 hypothetical protein PCC7418_2220 [Halothece sp. PCC 7418]
MTLNQYLYPHASYHGTVKPENLVFNANLQEFAQRMGYIANLETAGKISPKEAYAEAHALWESLETSYEQLISNNY